ncbi:antibiotic biosynthesis monooxygenase family protein [Bradyrhizobium prioriisuperbiae]|uniref:antibiotic biosynthesis monooxygenase family protein n=1 Tax=Bradyrhizobium prioriisuperbiae TaxID=2854389 RepID=UPI0028EEBD19|nr:antibiotic biosynthesis monooxygenase [Bradyrhizobium prioritasuperba]
MRIPITVGNRPLTAPVHDGAQANTGPRQRPVVIINTFVTKAGKLDEFIALQDAARRRFAGQIPGLRGSRMHRSRDGETAVLITAFNTLHDQKSWLASDLFAEHRAQILPLIEHASPKAFDIVYEAGEI